MSASRSLLLCLILSGAAAGAPPATVTGLLAPAADSGFAQVSAPRTFHFPADHGPHPQYRQEWWYLTGNLDAPGGQRFGFELTFFRYALTPSGSALPGDSAWRARELYLAHFAVTDPARRTFRFAQRLERGALGLAGAQGEPLKVWVDDWILREAAPGQWLLHAALEGAALDLELDATAAPVLNGDAGLSVKADEPGAASYYYSLPRIAVRGTLSAGGAPTAVSGAAWFDREWGSGALGAHEAGWDWFALQLQDGSTLMYYQLRALDGSRDAHSAGTFVGADGVAHALGAQVAIEVTAHWLSPQGTRYPAGWRLSSPAQGLDLVISPVLAAQELSGPPRYWEGAVDVAGHNAAGAVRGRGYVELVGYAGTPGPRAQAGGHAAHDR